MVDLMTEQDLLTPKFINVKMDKVEISNEKKTIIGTQSLATCVGILIYSEKNKRAIVAHVADKVDDILTQIIKIIEENNLSDSKLKYKIISGYYYNHYGIKEYLENFFQSLPTLFIPFDEKEISDNNIRIGEEGESHEFAFDASTGNFVTNKVLVAQDFSDINEEVENFSKKRR